MSGDQNPYEPPKDDRPIESLYRQNAFEPLFAPSIGLMIGCAFWIAPLLWFFTLVIQGKIKPDDGFAGEAVKTFDRIGYLYIISLLCGGVAYYGAMQMYRGRQYSACVAGAIAAIIPANPCLCLTIPFGIWALIILLRKDTRDAFAKV